MGKATNLVLEELMRLSELETKIQDNKLGFVVDGVQYRVRPMTIREKETLKNAMAIKTVALLEDPNIKTEEELIALWKAKGVDINELNKNFEALYTKYNTALANLGKAVANQAQQKELDILENKCESLREEIEGIQLKKSNYLSASYESQMLEEMYKIMMFMVLEKEDAEGNCSKVFTDYDKMLDEISEELLQLGLINIMLVNSHASLL